MRTYFLKKFSSRKGDAVAVCILLLLPWMAIGAEKDVVLRANLISTDKALSALLAMMPKTPLAEAISTAQLELALAQVNQPLEIQHETAAPAVTKNPLSALLALAPNNTTADLISTADWQTALKTLSTPTDEIIRPTVITASVSPTLSNAIRNILLTAIPFSLPTPLAVSACQSHLKAIDITPDANLNALHTVTLAALTDTFSKPFTSNINQPLQSAFTTKLHHALLASLSPSSDTTLPQAILIRPHQSFLAMMTDKAVTLDPIASDIVNPVINDASVTLTDNPSTPTAQASEATLFIDAATNDIHANTIVDIMLQPVKAVMSIADELASASFTKVALTTPFHSTKKQTLAQTTAPIDPENPSTLPPSLSDTLKIPPREMLSNNPSVPSLSVPEYVIIRPSDRVTFSSETSASVAKINVKEGNTFQANSILIVLDCRVQQADLQKALAQQQGTHMAVASARKLKSYGSISDFEFTQAFTQDEIAAAEVNKLRAIVEKCTIRAPFTGAVSDVLVHEHESVKPGDPLLKIVSTENLDFELQVPSTWLKWLHIGSIFYVHVNELDESVAVRITKINPQIDSVSQTVRIIGSITEPNTKLLPGMSGQANFPDNPENKKDAANT